MSTNMYMHDKSFITYNIEGMWPLQLIDEAETI